jgi:HEAT repeat protein
MHPSRLIPALVFAVTALVLAGCSGETTIADLINDLETGDVGVRKDALKALELRAPEAKEAIPAVTALLTDNVRDIRYRAVKLLSKIGVDSSVVPALAAALKDPDVEIRYYAAKSLSAVGPEAEGAVPSLIEALKVKENEKLFNYLMKSLRKIGPKASTAVPLLREMSQHSNESYRKEALEALESIESAVGA